MDPYRPPNGNADPRADPAAASRVSGKRSIWIVGLVVVFVTQIWVGVTSCMCGYMSPLSGLVVVPGFLLLLSLQFWRRRNPVWDRALGAIFLMIQALFVAKYGSDMLVGHP